MILTGTHCISISTPFLRIKFIHFLTRGTHERNQIVRSPVHLPLARYNQTRAIPIYIVLPCCVILSITMYISFVRGCCVEVFIELPHHDVDCCRGIIDLHLPSFQLPSYIMYVCIYILIHNVLSKKYNVYLTFPTMLVVKKLSTYQVSSSTSSSFEVMCIVLLLGSTHKMRESGGRARYILACEWRQIVSGGHHCTLTYNL